MTLISRRSSTRITSVVRFGLLLATLVSLVAIPSTWYHANAAQTVTVSMSDTAYLPATITINQGDTVIWNNNGTVVHTATARSGQADSWDSGDMNPGNIYSYTFTRPGNFSYYCIYHPDMAGNVIVQTPVPEFPGALAFATVGLAIVLALAIERGIRRSP
jgi:plastocyanin